MNNKTEIANCQEGWRLVMEAKKKTGIALLPRHGIYLTALGQGYDKRLAEQFKIAWKMIPLAARRRLLKHWKSGMMPPSIGALETWSGQKVPDEGGGLSLGQCDFEGFEIRFFSAAVDAMPDEILQILIIHELCHAHTYACGRTVNEEEDRRYMLTHWGVDNDKLVKWIDGEGFRLEFAHYLLFHYSEDDE